MQELRELAKKLLADGTVKVVIGYAEGRGGVRPIFAQTAADADKLLFDPRCGQNLATYLSPRRKQVLALGKPAVVVKGCDAKAAAGMIREAQRKRDEFVLIGVRCGGVLADARTNAAITETTVASRCPGCDARDPKIVDHLVGPQLPEPPGASALDARIAELEAMAPEERFAYWKTEFEKCVRCNACREICPMCFCVRCMADKSQPQWIESSPHARGNFAWHMTRALHQAGRCVGCGECERACPVGIPLGLLNRKIARVVAERFDYAVCDDPDKPAPIGTYLLEDEQEFIR
jgi:formate dehydrogenase (coenzyme F420) beta subunit